MSIPVRTPDQEYLPNGKPQTMRAHFSTERGYYLDWNIDIHFYNTQAHDLNKRIAERTDCVSFEDFMFLFRKSFAFLIRSLREVPPPGYAFLVAFRNRNVRYIITYLEEVDGRQRFVFKTVMDSSWKTKAIDQVFSFAM